MAMDTIIATLVCSLLALSFAGPQNDNLNVTDTRPTTGTTTTVAPSVISNLTENTTPIASTTSGNETTDETTAATTKGTTNFQTTLSTSTTTPQINHTSTTSATPGTYTTTSAATTPSVQTTGGYITSPDITVNTTATSHHTVNTTSDSMLRTTQGLGLNSSELNMTIVFSIILGVFAMALVLFMFQKCKHNIQYLPQPLTNSDDADTFVTDEDTLVISGGLYDGHPIYDNVPTAQEQDSQFRLEFLH